MSKQAIISQCRLIETRVEFTNAGRSSKCVVEFRTMNSPEEWQLLPMKPEPRWKAQERARAAFPNGFHN